MQLRDVPKMLPGLTWSFDLINIEMRLIVVPEPTGSYNGDHFFLLYLVVMSSNCIRSFVFCF